MRPPHPTSTRGWLLAAALVLGACLPLGRAAAGGAAGGASELGAGEGPRYKILAIVSMGGSSHTFDLAAVAGALAARCGGAACARALQPCACGDSGPAGVAAGHSPLAVLLSTLI